MTGQIVTVRLPSDLFLQNMVHYDLETEVLINITDKYILRGEKNKLKMKLTDGRRRGVMTLLNLQRELTVFQIQNHSPAPSLSEFRFCPSSSFSGKDHDMNVF